MSETDQEPYEGPLPSALDLADADQTLRNMQIMLVAMGKDARRQLPEFQQLLAQYKELGSNLHLLRSLVNERQMQEKQLKTQQEQLARMRDAARTGQPRVAYCPPQARAGTSLLAKIKRLQVEQGRAPLPAAPLTARTALQAAAGRGRSPDGMGAMRQAQLAYHAPQVMVGAAMVDKLNELKGEHPEAIITSQARAAEAPGHAAAPAAAVELDGLPEELPLALPKFVATMGPPYSKAIDQGPPVSNLQLVLAALGYDVPQTGVYDNKTFRGVQELQLERHLAVNGLVGLETRKLLNGMVTG